jgi:hypothetical protein
MLMPGIALGSTQPVVVTSADAPSPLLQQDKPVDWWFMFKLNAHAFKGCGGDATVQCLFGGDPKDYSLGQQFVYASNADATLQMGSGCAGDTPNDPLGATFGQVYNGGLHFVVWNDQFYDDPKIADCENECGSPWGHSKGMLAWNDAGEGFVLQVSTPSWPASGNKVTPRMTDGNTLGCVKDDDVMVSQHFFALRLAHDDVLAVLGALQTASVVTDPTNPQIVQNGGPAEVQSQVALLGHHSQATAATKVVLSSGVTLIAKPAELHVPPWQLVSAELGGVGMRAATWFTSPDEIHSTTADTPVTCWNDDLGKAGPVEIALSGSWDGQEFSLRGGDAPDRNHAKVGVDADSRFAVFGDMNQQGSLSAPDCQKSQNGRGGLFYVIEDATLASGITALIKGDSDPVP